MEDKSIFTVRRAAKSFTFTYAATAFRSPLPAKSGHDGCAESRLLPRLEAGRSRYTDVTGMCGVLGLRGNHRRLLDVRIRPVFRSVILGRREPVILALRWYSTRSDGSIISVCVFSTREPDLGDACRKVAIAVPAGDHSAFLGDSTQHRRFAHSFLCATSARKTNACILCDAAPSRSATE